jgi:hypothetical protein
MPLQSIIQGINGILAPNTGVVQLLANNNAGSGRRHRRRQLLQSSRSRATRQSKVRAGYRCWLPGRMHLHALHHFAKDDLPMLATMVLIAEHRPVCRT